MWREKSTVLGVTPLTAIIKMQLSELNQLDFLSVNLADGEESSEGDKQKLMDGEFSIVFGTPESWLGTNKWFTLLKSKVYQSKTIAIVADEAHCVLKWHI